MMQMEMMPPQQADFPSAIQLARMSDLVMNNNILHRLVRPTEQGTEVVSVNRLVNVVPFRRIYRFDRKDELNEFCNQLLRRPLVLQPVVHFGRGLGNNGSMACGLCYKDDKWVMLVNQTHPKILSRLQMGLDAARSAMAKGRSFEIKFAFSKLVEQVYKETLSRKEQDNASALDLLISYFRFSQWEYGDLIVRYYGYAASMGRSGGLMEMPTLNLTFNFEDLMYQEISWQTLGAKHYPRPHLSAVTEDEIRESLPAWTINGVSPLENIGEAAPAANYSYAQAGRLYESFRKKKRRPRRELADIAEGGAPPGVRSTMNDGIELRVPDLEDEDEWQQQQEYDEEYDDGRHGYDAGANPRAAGYGGQGGYQNLSAYSQDPNPVDDDGFYEEKGAKPKRGPKYDSHGHMYPEIRVQTGKPQTPRGNNLYPSASPEVSQGPYPNAHPSRSPGPYANATSPNPYANTPPTQSPSPYANLNPAKSPSPYGNTSPRSPGQAPFTRPSPTQDNGDYTPLPEQFTRLHMQQGSDRSSRSETGSAMADSGICSDSDGHVRDGSYDSAPYAKPKNSPPHRFAMDNQGFQHEEPDVNEAMRKHKELIAKMVGGAPPEADHGYHDDRQQRHTSQSSNKYSDGYHGNKSGPLPSPYAKGGAASTRSPYGHHGHAGVHYSKTNGYSSNLQSTSEPVGESFI